MSAQDPPPPERTIEHLDCPAEITLPPDAFRHARFETDLLADLRFCGRDDVEIPRVELRWNPAALDVRFTVLPPRDADIEIRLGARAYAANGIEISSQTRTFTIRAGKQSTHRIRMSRSSRWLQEFAGRLTVVVDDISPP
jgi:hypothetical protein